MAQKMDGTQKQGYQRTIRAAGGNKLDHRTDQAVQTAYVATGVVRSCMPVVGNGQVAEVAGQPSNQVATGRIQDAYRLDSAPGRKEARSRTLEASCVEAR